MVNIVKLDKGTKIHIGTWTAPLKRLTETIDVSIRYPVYWNEDLESTASEYEYYHKTTQQMYRILVNWSENIYV